MKKTKQKSKKDVAQSFGFDVIKTKYDLKSLQSAIVDNRFVAHLGQQIVIHRHIDNKKIQCTCVVKHVEGSTITVWDYTRSQFFSFDFDASEEDSGVIEVKLL